MVRFDHGNLVVSRVRDGGRRRSYARAALRALGPMAAAGAACWGVSLIPYSGDATPGMDLAFWCLVIQLAGAGGAGYVSTRYDPARDTFAGIVGGFVACVIAWYVELSLLEIRHAAEIALLILPLGALAVAGGSTLGRVAGVRRDRCSDRSEEGAQE